MPAYIPPVRGKYVPPKNRVVDPLACLAPENFPCFGNGGGIRKSTLDFKQQILNAEEERKKAVEASIYDPSKLGSMTREQKEKEGWVVIDIPKVPRTVYVKYGHWERPKTEIDHFLERHGLPAIPDERFDFEVKNPLQCCAGVNTFKESIN